MFSKGEYESINNSPRGPPTSYVICMIHSCRKRGETSGPRPHTFPILPILLRPLPGNHQDVVKLLLNAGAAYDVRTSDGFLPVDYASYNTAVRSLLQKHNRDTLYEIAEPDDLPDVPDYAVEGKATKKKKGGKKGGKKGKGKKGAKKAGKKSGKGKKKKKK